VEEGGGGGGGTDADVAGAGAVCAMTSGAVTGSINGTSSRRITCGK
jgi:hypothetical protein